MNTYYSGWFPAPNGAPELWFWTGSQWLDPAEILERQMTEAIMPHLEEVFKRGFAHGAALAARAAQSVLEGAECSSS